MSSRRAGLAVLAVLLVLLGGRYLRTKLGDAGRPPDQSAKAAADVALRAERLQDLTRARRLPAGVLDLVSLVLPDLVRLERLSLRQKSVTVAGWASDTTAVADFVSHWATFTV